jgi:hypothetical protein
MRPKLRDQVLDALSVEPGLGKQDLRRKFPDANARELAQALTYLVEHGLIEMRWPGKYCCLPQDSDQPLPALTADDIKIASFIKPPSKERLMAGR